MQVVQVHWAFPPTTGGVESHVADLATALAARGCDVTVVTGEERPEPRPGVAVVSCAALNLERIRAGEPLNDRELAVAITRLRPHVVHGHNLHHFATGPAVVLDALAQELDFAVHHTFHETWPDLLHDRPVYRGWAANYAVSQHVGEACEARIGFRPDVRPLGVDVHRFRCAADAFAHGGTPRLLHPARLLPWKGVHVSVEAVALLRDRGVPVHLTITDTARIADWEGELADYRRVVLDLIDARDVADRVALARASYLDMPRLYAAADVVLYPTLAAEPYGTGPPRGHERPPSGGGEPLRRHPGDGRRWRHRRLGRPGRPCRPRGRSRAPRGRSHLRPAGRRCGARPGCRVLLAPLLRQRPLEDYRLASIEK